MRISSPWLLLLASTVLGSATRAERPSASEIEPSIFAADNLVAWCIVPFDAKHRSPAERAAMVRRLGLRRVAYDWRREHVASFEDEILEYKKAGIEYFAFWSWHDAMDPLIQKHGIRPQIWLTLPSPSAETQEARVAAAAQQLSPHVERTRRLGLKLGLYNHGGWGGQPENLIAVCRHLRDKADAAHVGIVYNLHHAHDRLHGFAGALALMKPYLHCLNLNGMNDGAQPKILPVGRGQHDRRLLQTILDVGYDGPIGVLDHRSELDAEESLRENLDGLAETIPQLVSRPVSTSGLEVTLRLEPDVKSTRNSEGDFVELADGRILFIYSRFRGGKGDHATADLVSRTSTNSGRTWSRDNVVVVPNEAAMNVMSVSLLRLKNGEVALFYLRKESHEDCRPNVRFSSDECVTWSAPRACVPATDNGYFVLNNDRAYQLESGRIVLPLALHRRPGEKADWSGAILTYLSDDNGRTWRSGKSMLKTFDEKGERVITQEPGVVALEDGRLLLYCRTRHGSQYLSYSKDAGDTWSPLVPSQIRSPLSPAPIERMPGTGDLMMVWNNHENIAPELEGRRTPLAIAVSPDDGETWRTRTLFADPDGWYCYTAIHFTGKDVLLGHCAGRRGDNDNGLETTQVTRVSLDWLYPASSKEK